MIIHEVTQGSPEWFDLRLGVATSSCFAKIITPKTGKLSSQADAYANKLIAEIINGYQEDDYKSEWMERGNELEEQAVKSYEFDTGYDVERIGFITNDDKTIGSSPDGLVFKDGKRIGGIEIKCPKASTHIANLLRVDNAIDPSYIPQVQGQCLIGELDFVDWYSFHPKMPAVNIRTHKDDEYCEKLSKALDQFLITMQDKIKLLKEKGVLFPEKVKEQISEDDLTKYLGAG